MFTRNKIKKEWRELERALDNRVPNYSSNLAKPSSKKELNEFEAMLGYKIPEELKHLYLLCNGELGKFIAGPIYGFVFMSIEGVTKEWNKQKTLLESFDEETKSNLNLACKSLMPNKVKSKYINLKWIPIAHDSAGNFIGVDCDPDSKGKYGQVINFGRDENDKYVIADSVKQFITELTATLDSASCTMEEFDGEKVFVFDGNYHALDYMKEKLGFA